MYNGVQYYSVSFNSNTTGVTSGAWTSGTPVFTPFLVGFVLLNPKFSV
jgi:hypothetical protein